MNDIMELIFVLDKSGSMYGLEKDTIGGFNSLIEKQRKEKGETYVTTVLFDQDNTLLHDRLNLKDIKNLTEDDYVVGGCTALMDAVGTTIEHIDNIHKYIRKEDVPSKTMFVIITDGYENASRKYELHQIKKMINAKKEQGWEFIFLGANIDAVESARSYGIDAKGAANYCADAKGTATNFDVLRDAICYKRENNELAGGWNEKINEDYKKRNKKNKD